jgi:hypothetical protein
MIVRPVSQLFASLAINGLSEGYHLALSDVAVIADDGLHVYWIKLRRLWSGWKRALILVQRETVVSWHRAGFKPYDV